MNLQVNPGKKCLGNLVEISRKTLWKFKKKTPGEIHRGFRVISRRLEEISKGFNVFQRAPHGVFEGFKSFQKSFRNLQGVLEAFQVDLEHFGKFHKLSGELQGLWGVSQSTIRRYQMRSREFQGLWKSSLGILRASQACS